MNNEGTPLPRYPGIVNAVFNQPWAVLPETYARLQKPCVGQAELGG